MQVSRADLQQACPPRPPLPSITFASQTEARALIEEAAADLPPSPDADLPNGECRCIIVATPGDVALVDGTGTEATVFVEAGSPMPVLARRIKATGTTATGIRALY